MLIPWRVVFLCLFFFGDVFETNGLKVWIVDCFLPILQVSPLGMVARN